MGLERILVIIGYSLYLLFIVLCIFDLYPLREPNRFSKFRVVKMSTTKGNTCYVVQHKTGILIRRWKNCLDCIGLDTYCLNSHSTLEEAEEYMKNEIRRATPPERIDKIIEKYQTLKIKK